MWNYDHLEDLNPYSCLSSLQRSFFHEASGNDQSGLVRYFLKINLQFIVSVLSDPNRRFFKLLVPEGILNECFDQYLWLITALHAQKGPDRGVEQLQDGTHFIRAKIRTQGNQALSIYCWLKKRGDRYWLKGKNGCSHVTPKSIDEITQYQVEILPPKLKRKPTPLGEHEVHGCFPPPPVFCDDEEQEHSGSIDVQKKVVIIDSRKDALSRLERTGYLQYLSAGELDGKGILNAHHHDSDIPAPIGTFVVKYVCDRDSSKSSLQQLLSLYPEEEFIILTHKQTDFPQWISPGENKQVHAIFQLSTVESLLDFTERQAFNDVVDGYIHWAWDPWALNGLRTVRETRSDSHLERHLLGYCENLLNERIKLLTDFSEEFPETLGYDVGVSDLASNINTVGNEGSEGRLKNSLCKLYRCVVNPDADGADLELAISGCEKWAKRLGLDEGTYGKWHDLLLLHPKKQVLEALENDAEPGSKDKLFSHFRLSARSSEMKEYCRSLNSPRLLVLSTSEADRLKVAMTSYKRCFSAGVFGITNREKLLPGLSWLDNEPVVTGQDYILDPYETVDDLDKWLAETEQTMWERLAEPSTTGGKKVSVRMIIDCGVDGRIYADKKFSAFVVCEDDGKIVRTGDLQERDTLLFPRNQNSDIFQYVRERSRAHSSSQYERAHSWHQPFQDYCNGYLNLGHSKKQLYAHLREQSLVVSDMTIRGWLHDGDRLAPEDKHHLEIIAKLTQNDTLMHSAGDIAQMAQDLRSKHQQLGRKLAKKIRIARITGTKRIKVDGVRFDDVFDRFIEVTVDSVKEVENMQIRSPLVNRLLTLEDLDEDDS